jgi:hypothetical protein
VIQEQAAGKIHGNLVFALESARMRLSVAIAMEAKSTPRDRWAYYLETTDRMRRCIKRLRKNDIEFQRDPREWGRALDKLRTLPDPGRASRLCEMLRNIVAELE